MAFTTLMMFQLFNVFNCRSTWRSAFSGMFNNGWLIAAVLLSLLLHVVVIYVPFLQTAFHTVPLSSFDWVVATAVAASLLVLMELYKLAFGARTRPATAPPASAFRAGSPSRAGTARGPSWPSVFSSSTTIRCSGACSKTWSVASATRRWCSKAATPPRPCSPAATTRASTPWCSTS
jgi:hypothetical protein